MDNVISDTHIKSEQRRTRRLGENHHSLMLSGKRVGKELCV